MDACLWNRRITQFFYRLQREAAPTARHGVGHPVLHHRVCLA